MFVVERACVHMDQYTLITCEQALRKWKGVPVPAAGHWFMSHVNELANTILASLRQHLGALPGPSQLKGPLTKVCTQLEY